MILQERRRDFDAAFAKASSDAPMVQSLDGRKWARISLCGNYRYVLGRGWTSGLPTMVVIGINPSKADAEVPDPTLTRCVNFAADAGFGGLVMLNLFAWRAKDVRVLSSVPNPVGPFADYWLDDCTDGGQTVVWASGSPSKVPGPLRARFALVRDRLVGAGRVLHALAYNQDGWPSHPLMLKATCRPQRWPL